MRRRLDGSVPPRELLVFQGRAYATAAEWEAAFEEWHQARARWLSLRELPEDALPPTRVDGDCPFDESQI
jgi:hypothetical protein